MAHEGPGASPNLARFDLVSLRLVVLCAELGSLSAAARSAHLSVSGASSRLSRLEETFGTALFRRHWRGLAPTPEGRIVAAQADQMLGLLHEMNDSLHRMRMQARPAASCRVLRLS
jgi:DNA-binding transcriptional LysR family regulator